MKKEDNPFLKHLSYANCAYPIPLEVENITQLIVDGKCRVIGQVAHSDLANIRQSLIGSGLLTEEEIELYFP